MALVGVSIAVGPAHGILIGNTWANDGLAPQLLVGAWVDPDNGAVRLPGVLTAGEVAGLDRKSTRLNSSHRT